MRARAKSVEEVKKSIEGMRGRNLSVSINKGRKKTTHIKGVIEDLFPSVFTLRAAAGDIVSFSYSDVICGEIVLE